MNEEAVSCPTDSKFIRVHRAVQLITCNYHMHLFSKAGSVIGTKSPSPAFKWNGSKYTEP